MPARPLITVEVTPRFEVFYALQAFESKTGDRLARWQREMERRVSPSVRDNIGSVAPSALMWPLLADSLRDEPPAIDFPEMLLALRGMDDSSFQRCVLSGVFKSPGSVDSLMSGKMTLKRTVAAESRVQERLLSLLGLHPFARDSSSVNAFERIVSEPGTYRREVVTAIQSFWDAAFSITWAILEPQMQRSAKAMQATLARGGLAALSEQRRLPVTQKGGAIVTMKGSSSIPLASTLAVHLIPSAFNITGLWAAYADSRRRTRFYIPVLDPQINVSAATLTKTVQAPVQPALIFNALGDTTRYAIASAIARQPMTSVELARAFDVSKPTISHHVQLLRAAGLLHEEQTGNGTVLSLNRRILESASSAAAREMFSGTPEQVIRRTRKANNDTR